MLGRNQFTLLKVRGIPVGVDWSWFLVLFLVIWFLSGVYRGMLGDPQDSTEPYLLAVVSAAGFFASILLHELGHALVALRNRIGITRITLWMFGGIAGLEKDPDTPGVEFRIAAAGPLVTLVLAAVCVGAGLGIDSSGFWAAAALDEGAGVSGAVAVLAFLANINIGILLFNLLPAFPLDGGRITRAIAWRLTGERERATIFAARLGQAFALIFIGLGVLLMLTIDLFSGVWLAIIGWMLGSSARATAARSELNRRIGDLRVSDVMDAEPVAIPSDATVERALDEYFLRYRWPWFPVVDAAHRFVGLLNRGAADSVPEASRTSRTVVEVLDSGADPEAVDAADQRVSSDAPLESLLANLQLRRLGGLAAVDTDGRLIGVITLDQVGRALRDAVGPGASGIGRSQVPRD
jgi:Zn-dependent protease